MEPTCPAIAYTSFRVNVIDAATKRPICDASVIFVDRSLMIHRLAAKSLAPGAACTYEAMNAPAPKVKLAALKPGYHMTAKDVELQGEPCHFVSSKDFTLELSPIPAPP